ncbi:MAG: preprotein translocase subunit YajC [Clostridia bacterium]|nr:preprotein translocase subunit YajC [Clostridia bacterium]
MLLFNLLEQAATDPPKEGNPITSYIIMGVLFVLIIVFFIFSSRQNKKKQKQQQEMINGIKKGDTITTIGGIIGAVVEINDDKNYIVLETGTSDNKMTIKFDKAAIYKVDPKKD